MGQATKKMTNTSFKYLIIMQLLNILFSLSGVMVKVASNQMVAHGFFSKQTIFIIVIYVALLGMYAFFWQKILKHVSLSSAYLSKGLLIFWTLIWAFIFFNESITVWHIICTGIIVFGTILVNANEV